MSAILGYAGGFLLVIATVPQVVQLTRTRSARDFAWGFALLNFAGITFLALRSVQLHEWGFVAANALTAAFWALVLALKVPRDENSLTAGRTT